MRARLLKYLSHNIQLGLLLVFFFIIAFFTLISSHFLSLDNLFNIFNQTATISIVAFGMTLVMLAGGIDMSVGSVVSLSAVACAIMLNAGLSIPAAMLFSVLIGMTFGFLNGFVSVRWGIQPFLITLGSMSIARGAALILSRGTTIYIENKTYLQIAGRAYIGPISVLFLWTLFFFILITFFMRKTAFGRRIRAVGGNPTAAKQAGIHVNRIRIGTFLISGALAAFSGLLLAGRLGSGLPTVGVGMELDAITATVLGGTGFQGEGGSLVGTLVGALIMGTVLNGLTILGINPWIQEIVKGIIIITAVLLFKLRSR